MTGAAKMTSPDDVNAFLKPRVSSATTVADVEALMTPLSLDSAWVHLGGTGARQQIFRLAGDLRALFQFDGEDRLVAYAAYRSADGWPNDKTGESVPPLSSPSVPLIFVSPGRTAE